MDDRAIIDLFFERSEQAVPELMRRYGPAVRQVVSRVLASPQDAEECVNDAWLQVWDTVPPHRPDSLGSYVCRIARNLALNRYHANTAQKRNSYYDVVLDEIEGAVPALASVESEYDARELTAYIDRFLTDLAYDDRYLFLRRYWYADPIPVIARAMGLRPHAVSVRLFRLRKKLQAYLTKEGMLA